MDRDGCNCRTWEAKIRNCELKVNLGYKDPMSKKGKEGGWEELVKLENRKVTPVS